VAACSTAKACLADSKIWRRDSHKELRAGHIHVRRTFEVADAGNCTGDSMVYPHLALRSNLAVRFGAIELLVAAWFAWLLLVGRLVSKTGPCLATLVAGATKEAASDTQNFKICTCNLTRTITNRVPPTRSRCCFLCTNHWWSHVYH